MLSPELFVSILEAVPDDWLVAEPGLSDPAAHRAAYLAYLTGRLAAHRPVAEEAERVRTGS